MKLFFKGLTSGQVYIDLDGNGTYETYDLNDIQGGLDLDENLDYSKIQVKANSKVFSNLQVIKNFEIQKIENQLGSDENGKVGFSETISPYAKKIYVGRSYVTALVFDHTQITGVCKYIDVYDNIHDIDLSTYTENLYLTSTDIVSFELEINGLKEVFNVVE